jgi:NCAIR mutase (PurE)-related protein
MRDVLEAVAAGELSPEAAQARLRGYATTEAGRFDAARERRSGVPEAVLAAGKTPAEVADLVDVPVIGLPVSMGHGHGGDGEAALAGMLQSCTAMTVVNVDAGFTAGAQAGLLARGLDAARTGESDRDQQDG